MNLAKHAWDAGVIGRVDELLEQHRPKPGETDLRGFEWYYLYRLCHSDLLTLEGHGVAYSPDGKCVAGPSKDTVKVRDAQTGQVLLTINSGWVSRVGVAFSPDGKRLAAGSGPRFTNTSGEVKVWDTQTGQELLTLKAGGHYDGLAFSPDGHWLASDAGSAVTIWDATPLPEKASPKPDRR
jgi:WD40 repeat protein